MTLCISISISIYLPLSHPLAFSLRAGKETVKNEESGQRTTCPNGEKKPESLFFGAQTPFLLGGGFI